MQTARLSAPARITRETVLLIRASRARLPGPVLRLEEGSNRR